MEEKEPIKVNLKTVVIIAIVMIILVAIIIGGIVFYFLNNYKTNNNTASNNIVTNNTNTNTSSQNKVSNAPYEEVTIKGETYYERIGKTKWSGEYHQEEFETAEAVDITEVVSYEEYLEKLDSIETLNNKKLKAYYSDKNSNYIILAYSTGYSWCEMELIDVVENDDEIIVYGDENVNGVMADGSGFFIAIPTDMPVGTTIEYKECYSSSEILELKEPWKYNHFTSVDKPIIYLYPTEESEISVKLLKENNITCSYPKYKDEWKVFAKPNGDLTDLNSGKNLYSLYYECKNDTDIDVNDYGFVVKGEDTIKFLEEKLAVLGLTERETEEFIVYWLPKLEANKYNYIRFASIDEINENMPLEISKQPDSLIRVLMIFKGLDEPITVQEQKLETPERTGFVAVEWGGTEIK